MRLPQTVGRFNTEVGVSTGIILNAIGCGDHLVLCVISNTESVVSADRLGWRYLVVKGAARKNPDFYYYVLSEAVK